MLVSLSRLNALSSDAVDLGARVAGVDLSTPLGVGAGAVPGGELASALTEVAESLGALVRATANEVTAWGESVSAAAADYLSTDDDARRRSANLARPV